MSKKKLSRRLLALLLTLVMAVGTVPVSVSADIVTSNNITTGVEANKLYLEKTATLNADGTYDFELSAFSTGAAGLTSTVTETAALDIVLVIDQSGSMATGTRLSDLKAAVTEFVEMVAAHGRTTGKEHRIAIAGFGSLGAEPGNQGSSGLSTHPVAGGSTSAWVNTGIFLNNGDFKNYISYAGATYNKVHTAGETTHSATYDPIENELLWDQHTYYVRNGLSYQPVYAKYNDVMVPGTNWNVNEWIENSEQQVYENPETEPLGEHLLSQLPEGTLDTNKIYHFLDADGMVVTLVHSSQEGRDINEQNPLYVRVSSMDDEPAARSGGAIEYYVIENGEMTQITERPAGDVAIYQKSVDHDTGWYVIESVTVADTEGEDSDGNEIVIKHDKYINMDPYYNPDYILKDLEGRYYEYWWENEFDAEQHDLYVNHSYSNDVPLTSEDYANAWMDVSTGANGQGEINSNILTAISKFGANGATRISYGMEMAYQLFGATLGNASIMENDNEDVLVVFTDGEPGYSGFEGTSHTATSYAEAHRALKYADVIKKGWGDLPEGWDNRSLVGVDGFVENDIPIYTIALAEDEDMSDNAENFLKALSSDWDIKNDAIPGSWTSGSVGGMNLVYEAPSSARNDLNYITTANLDTGRPAQTGYYNPLSASGDLTDIFVTVQKDITTSTAPDININEDSIFREILSESLTLDTSDTDYGISIELQSGYMSGDTITWTDYGQYYVFTPTEIDDSSADVIKMKFLVDSNDDRYNSVMDMQHWPSGALPDGPVSDPMDGGSIAGETLFWPVKENNYGKDEESKGYIELEIYNVKGDNPDTSAVFNPQTIDIINFPYDKLYFTDYATNGNSYVNPEGYPGVKLVLKIKGVTLTEDMLPGQVLDTNNTESGIWAPIENGNRELLATFPVPTTIVSYRDYVIDYAKPIVMPLSRVTVDNAVDPNVDTRPLHIQLCDGETGYAQVTKTNNALNYVTSATGKYGDLQILNDGSLKYTPTTTSWNGYDVFHVLCVTNEDFVTYQEANRVTADANAAAEADGVEDADNYGFVWNKIVIMPANNVYFEEDFGGDTGIVYSGNGWSDVSYNETTQKFAAASETLPQEYDTEFRGDTVHGAEPALKNDTNFSGGVAKHTKTSRDNAKFTFTGTGVDIYALTSPSTTVIVNLFKVQETFTTADANTFTLNKNAAVNQTLIVDTVSDSGAYYQIPVVSFNDLSYGKYLVEITVSNKTDSAQATDDYGNPIDNETAEKRCDFYLDGIRVYNPLGVYEPDTGANYYWNNAVKNNPDPVVAARFKPIEQAYGAGEMYSRFVEVRDILLDAGSLSTDNPATEGDEATGKAVFIDRIKDDVSTKTTEIAQFKQLGPKNEVYLDNGQMVAFKVGTGYNYYVGLKSPTGASVDVHINDETYTVDHTTDIYYPVYPTADGYVSISCDGINDSNDDLRVSITKLKICSDSIANAQNDDAIFPKTSQTEIVMFAARRYVELDAQQANQDNGSDNETEGNNPADLIEPWIEEFTPFMSYIDEIREEISKKVETYLSSVFTGVFSAIKNYFETLQ